MPLRLLELTVSGDDVDGVVELLEEKDVVQFWRSSVDGAELLRVLLDAERVETLTDALTDRIGARDSFRVVVVPVEATLPRIADRRGDETEDPAGRAGVAAARVSRDELYEDVLQASRLTIIYAVMTGLSAVVAAVGLIRDDVAIVIGAMVIAPLLGPNVALSLACTLGDLALARRSLKSIAAGVSIAAVVSLAIGAGAVIDPFSPELASRSRVDFGDVALALAAGSAASLAFTSGVSSALVGVMVAVALLPPLVAAGLLAGGGYTSLATGAVTLTLTNLTCINLAAVATFLAQKVGPRTWWEAERARRATRIAVVTWVAMLLVLIAVMLSGRFGIL